MDSSVFISVALWSTSKPVFRISTVSVTPNFKRLITGSYNGQLCLWDLNLKKKSTIPTNVLIAHTDTVTCLASTNEYVISSCEGQMMCRWNLDDGYCSKMNTSLFIHRKMQLFLKPDNKEELLFTCGDYSEIFVIHPFTLQVIFIFHSKTSNTWISNFQVTTSQNSQIVSGITNNGYVKLWLFDDLTSDLHSETQSCILPITNAVDLKYNPSLTVVLIVSTNGWMIYDSEFSKCFCRGEDCTEERLLGGDFCNEDEIVVWTHSGKFYLFKIHDSAYKLISVYIDSFNQITVFEPALSLVKTDTEKYLLRGDSQGRIRFWKVDSQQKESLPVLSTALTENWVSNENGFFNSFIEYSTVTCCIYVLETDKFFVGCFDGSIASIPATESLMSFYFPSISKKPVIETLIGHKGKINCLLYPYEKYSYFNKSHLVSGGSDFSVCLWNIFEGELLYKFCVQSGEILRLIVPPEDFSMPVKLSICSVSSDHSVAVLNLKDQRCVILTSRHEYPVVTVHWKPLDDFIIIECFDGTIYVWQIETGHLERVLNGVLAQEVIYACSEPEYGIPAFNFYINENRPKKNSMKQKIFNVLASSNCSPFKLSRFLTNDISESHVFLCDVESALAQFSRNFKSEALDCAINSNAYLLTKALNNDLQKKYSASLEKIKQHSDVLQEKRDYPRNNNINPNIENIKTSENNVKWPTSGEGIFNLVQFFLSSIHFWGVDPHLDEIFSSKLGLVKPEKAVCFGIYSQPGIYSLYLPTGENSWRKSSTLFAYICVAMMALSKILLSNPNRELTGSKRNWREELLFSFYELNCLNLCEELRIPRPKVEILAKAWQNKCPPLREIVRKLFTNYLQGLDANESATLLEFWYKYLPHFKILDKTLSEKVDFENSELKTVALVLFGAAGSDLKFKSSDSSCQENYVYQTCAAFVYIMLLPISQKQRFSVLETIAIEFIGRGYIVWEQFLKIEKITPILFKMCGNLPKKCFEITDAASSLNKIAAARNALKSIAIARTAAFINFLKGEINQLKLSQNYHFLTDNSKAEVLSILTFLLEKTPYIMLLYLNDAISLIVHCIDFSHLRQENLANLVPAMRKFRQVHHSVASQRIAVGLATGSLVLHDLKTGKVLEIPAHKDSVSALKFSEDGKSLVSYSCYENRLSFWQVLTGIFGLGQINVKCTKTCQTYQIHDEEIRNHLEIASLTWTDKKSVMLSLCDGTEDIFHS